MYLLINKDKNNNVTNNDKSSIKTAVIYFSATNTTEEKAKCISDYINADLIRIEPKDEYTSDDLDYSNSNCRANIEQKDNNSRPIIKNNIDINDYDVIYLGYPIWWGDVPKIILNFLDTHDLSNKKVILFCTSGGSSIDKSMNTIKNYNENINVIDGKELNVTKKEIINWVNNLGY